MVNLLVPWFLHILASTDSPLQLPRLESVSFVPICFMIGELLLEVGGRVGHGLVLAWFASCLLHLVFLDSSLQFPGQEKYFSIPFCETQLSVTDMV